MLTPQGQQVINNGDSQSKQQSERAASADVGDPKAHAKQPEHETGGRKRQSLMYLGTPFAGVRVRWGIPDELSPFHLFHLISFTIDASRIVLLFLGDLETDGHLIEARGGVRGRLIAGSPLFLPVPLLFLRRLRVGRGWRYSHRLCPRDWLWELILRLDLVLSFRLACVRLMHGAALQVHFRHIRPLALTQRAGGGRHNLHPRYR